jgi:hypothetical protein
MEDYYLMLIIRITIGLRSSGIFTILNGMWETHWFPLQISL